MLCSVTMQQYLKHKIERIRMLFCLLCRPPRKRPHETFQLLEFCLLSFPARDSTCFCSCSLHCMPSITLICFPARIIQYIEVESFLEEGGGGEVG